MQQITQDWDSKNDVYVKLVKERRHGRLVLVRREAHAQTGVTIQHLASPRGRSIERLTVEQAPAPGCRE